MEKSYTDELAAWVEKRGAKKRRQDAAAVAFLAVKSDVVTAMESGYALTTIWEHMHEVGMVKSSYETFRTHVHRFIRSPSTRPASITANTPSTGGKPQKEAKGDTSEERQKTTTPKKSEPPTVGGFTFDAIPKKEDLF